MSMAEQEIPLGLLLWQRIHNLGIGSIMGVPGDMNLELLDYINEVDGLDWIGNANELNAAYAADGYCRVKGQSGVIVTTMGVGELSALNGIAGAYTEQVKVIHIVGTTSTAAQKKRLMIHHSLGPSPDHKIYEKISHHVRAAHCWLDNTETASCEINRVIRECYVQSLPVYIFVPTDMVHLSVKAGPAPSVSLAPTTDHDAQMMAVTAVLEKLYSARFPVILVDALVARHLGEDITRDLVDVLKFPTFSTSMGKSIIDETKPYFLGVYNGQVSVPDVCKAVDEDSDLVIDIGPILSDSNTGGFSRKISEEKMISIHPHHVIIGTATFGPIGLVSFLSVLLEKLDKSRLPKSYAPVIRSLAPAEDDQSDKITQSWIWGRLGQFLQPGDIILGESGTAQFGLPDAQFPENITYLTQVYYGSIGYSVPACLGAAIAQKEKGQKGRIILVVGDGSLQLTVQEIGTMIKLNLTNIIIMVINNKGYTIERAIHGPEEGERFGLNVSKCYNDIASWNHQKMLEFFGAKNGGACSRAVTTKQEFEEVARLPEYTHPSSIQVLEIHMDVMDVPWRLAAQIALVNAQKAASAP